MSDIWDKLVELQIYFEDQFNLTGDEVKEVSLQDFNKPGWINRVWTSKLYRRAHIDIIDVRDTKGMWMMHCCIFPHVHNPAPIFGFDVIAGKNKITGCFHDFSPAGRINHKMINWFSRQVATLEWRKERELPDWAQRIFSPNIIAVANIQQEEEMDQIVNTAQTNIDYYLEQIGHSNYTTKDTTAHQNFYLQNQKLNPHNPRVMANLGLEEKFIHRFINECMFPEI